MKSADVPEKEEIKVSSADDELTSLSWLQNSNLLFNTALCPVKVMSVTRKGEVPEVKIQSTPEVVTPLPKVESPTSDFEEQDPMEQSENENDEHYNGLDQSATIPYNPQIHIKSKPPYSFSSLIFMAIEDSTEKALPVKDIYAWVIHHFPYYKTAPTGWKNSVRHNLSLNKCFCKVDKSPTLGKGSLWMVDPAYRPNLLQTLSKTPFPVSPRSDHMYVSNTRIPDNRAPLDHLSRLKEGICEYKGELENRVKYEKPISTKIEPFIHNEMYPHIPKDDVEAALAMVTLRQGRTFLPNSQMASVNFEPQPSSEAQRLCSKRKRKQCHNELVDPSMDHSYVSDLVSGENKRIKRDSSSPVDEAFSEDSFESEEEKTMGNLGKTPGNNALLNLASIATSLASHSQLFVNNRDTKDYPFSSFRKTEFCRKNSIHNDSNADRHI